MKRQRNMILVCFVAAVMAACGSRDNGPAGSIPQTPASVTLTINGTSISITWTDVVNETGYDLYDMGAFITHRDANTLSFVHANLAPGSTHCYALAAVNEFGASPLTAQNCLTVPVIPPPPTTPPAAPTLHPLTLSGLTILAVWDDNSDNEDLFIIRRNGTEVGRRTANVTTFPITGNETNAVYTVTVEAFNAAGSSPSNTRSITIGTPPAAPSAPTAFTATASGNCVNFGWSDTATNEEGFRLREGATVVATPGPNASSDSLCSVSVGTHTYALVAFNSVGESAAVTASATVVATGPAAPANLALSQSGVSAVTATWADMSANEEGFRVYLNGGLITPLPANTVSFVFVNLTPGLTYTVQIGAFAGVLENRSATLSITLTISAPAAPTSLLALAASTSSAQLSWLDNATNESGYEVRRNGAVVITGLAANTQSYADTGLSTGVQYCYRVRAMNPSGFGESNESCVTLTPTPPPPPPEAPQWPALRQIDDAVEVSWLNPLSTQTEFRVYRDGTRIQTLGPDELSFVDDSLMMGSTHRYRVASANDGGETSSPELRITLAPPPGNDPQTAWMDGWAGQNASLNRSYADAERGTVLRATRTSGSGPSEPPSFQVFHPISVNAGEIRVFRGWVKVAADAEVDIEIGQRNRPWDNLGLYTINPLAASQWSYLNYVYVATGTESQAKATFLLGKTTGAVLIDDASEYMQ